MHLLGAVVGDDDELAGLLGVLDPHPAGHLADRSHTLGGARLEQLDDTRQTVGDVLTRDTAGVERAHGQLRAGLADGLRGDDADGLADVDQLAAGQRTAVAGGAGADLASQVRTERTRTSSTPPGDELLDAATS